MIANVALAFFMMPFILHSLGDRMYGIWVLIGAIMGYSSYLDLGLSSAVNRFVSRAVGRGDVREINELINTSFILYLIIGAVIITLTLALAAAVSLFTASQEDLTVMRVLILLVGFSMAIGFPSRSFGSILGANLKYEISGGIELLCLLLRNFLILLFFSIGYGIIALGIIFAGVTLLSYALNTYFAFHSVGGFRFDLKLYNGKRIRELFSYSIYTFINKLSEILIFRVDLLVISAFIGVAASAHYSIASTMVSYFLYFIFNIFALLGPVFSQDEGRGDEESIRKKFLVTTKIAVYLNIFLGMMAIFYGRYFIERWMGPAYTDAYPALVVLMIAIIVQLVQMPSTTMLYNISKHRFLAYAGVAEGLLNLGLSLLLVNTYGMLGVALGTAVPMIVIRLAIQPVYACRTTGISLSRYYINTLIPCAAIAFASLLSVWYLARPFVEPEYPILLALAAAHTLFYGLCIFVFGFSKKERAYLFDYRGRKAGAVPSAGQA